MYPKNLNKRHIVQAYDDTNIIIEFTIEQDIYPEEEFIGMDAYECYILDDDNEAAILLQAPFGRLP
jgi:hypothetical protein